VAPSLDRKIERMVAVEVADGNAVGMRPARDRERRARRRTETSLPIAEEDGDTVRVMVGKREVERSVAVEIAYRDVVRILPRGKRRSRRRRKAALAIAEEHRHVAAAAIRDDEVRLAVAVDVRDGDARRGSPDPEVMQLAQSERPGSGRQGEK